MQPCELRLGSAARLSAGFRRRGASTAPAEAPTASASSSSRDRGSERPASRSAAYRPAAARRGRFEAGGGNRTRIISLEGWSSTIELHPRVTVEPPPHADSTAADGLLAAASRVAAPCSGRAPTPGRRISTRRSSCRCWRSSTSTSPDATARRGPARSRTPPVLALLAIAFWSPIHHLGLHYLLSAHLLQNVLLAEWAPLLVVLGVSPAMAKAFVALRRLAPAHPLRSSRCRSGSRATTSGTSRWSTTRRCTIRAG